MTFKENHKYSYSIIIPGIQANGILYKHLKKKLVDGKTKKLVDKDFLNVFTIYFPELNIDEAFEQKDEEIAKNYTKSLLLNKFQNIIYNL